LPWKYNYVLVGSYVDEDYNLCVYEAMLLQNSNGDGSVGEEDDDGNIDGTSIHLEPVEYHQQDF